MSTEIAQSNTGAASGGDKFEILVGTIAKKAAAQFAAHIKPDAFARTFLTEARRNPKLRECDATSIGICLATAGMLGLQLSGPLGEAYPIPRKRKDGSMECTMIVGYKGYARLARNSGEVANMSARVVYRDDDFSVTYGFDETLTHVPKTKAADRVPENITHAYATLTTKDGARYFEVLDIDDIHDRRKRGASGRNASTPWDTDFAAMARKSAIRALLGGGLVPLSNEIAEALEYERKRDDAIDGGEIEIKPTPRRTASNALGIEQKPTIEPVVEQRAEAEKVTQDTGDTIEGIVYDNEP